MLSFGGRAPETTNREGGYREKKNQDKHAEKKEKARNCPRKGGERRNVSGGVWEHRSPRPPFAGRNPFRKQRTTTTRNGGRTFIHSAHSSVAGFCARRNLFCGRRESQAQIARYWDCVARVRTGGLSSVAPRFRPICRLFGSSKLRPLDGVCGVWFASLFPVLDESRESGNTSVIS